MVNVGILGTGQIGARVGARLGAAGHSVVGYDIADTGRGLAASHGLRMVNTADELAAQSELIITCVTDGVALENAIIGPDGIAKRLQHGQCIIDLTSAEPWISRELGARLNARGIGFLDAPVSGGVPAAEQGRMNFMIGGKSDLLGLWRPLLSVLGDKFVHVGDVGSGHTLKAMNMLSMAGSLLGTAEIIALGNEMGGNAAELVSVLDSSIGGSYVTTVHFPRYILSGTYNSGFTISLMQKDVRIAVELAGRSGVASVVGPVVRYLYDCALKRGHGASDNTLMVRSLMEAGPAKQASGFDKTVFIKLAADVNQLIGQEVIGIGLANALKRESIVDVLMQGSGATAVLPTLIKAPAPSSLIGPLTGELRDENCVIASKSSLFILAVALQARKGFQ